MAKRLNPNQVLVNRLFNRGTSFGKDVFSMTVKAVEQMGEHRNTDMACRLKTGGEANPGYKVHTFLAQLIRIYFGDKQITMVKDTEHDTGQKAVLKWSGEKFVPRNSWERVTELCDKGFTYNDPKVRKLIAEILAKPEPAFDEEAFRKTIRTKVKNVVKAAGEHSEIVSMELLRNMVREVWNEEVGIAHSQKTPKTDNVNVGAANDNIIETGESPVINANAA